MTRTELAIQLLKVAIVIIVVSNFWYRHDRLVVLGAVFAGEHVDRRLGRRAGGRAVNLAKVGLHVDIGRVLQALDLHGLSANTIAIFTSDNGGERFSNIWPLAA
jgi:hypothetical protein